ncbi:hypothetical protein ElyMa_006801400 [Elysia marginata]|uniref:Uncharacterized protein n=1 Tax=Elysia marginata TaxID=1093978 RepID=A0AAV4J4P5_9GAST|nr:hypothetical protein ElyMa_006801400 [Elysia marginata]
MIVAFFSSDKAWTDHSSVKLTSYASTSTVPLEPRGLPGPKRFTFKNPGLFEGLVSFYGFAGIYLDLNCMPVVHAWTLCPVIGPRDAIGPHAWQQMVPTPQGQMDWGDK